MGAKHIFTQEQLDEFKSMVLDETVSKAEVQEKFGISASKVETMCQDLEIKGIWTKAFTCVVCGKEFRAAHVSQICPECKATPSTCVVCGKPFKRIFPYNQKTCSAKCRGIYRKESGIAKAGAQKMKETKLEKYGTLDPTSVSEQKNGGQLNERICPLCGKVFVPTAVRQVYCSDDHYGPCPVCGKPTLIKDPGIGPLACSEECRMARINATCLERYGNKDAVNSEHAKKLARQTSLEKYGVEYYTQSEEAKQHYKDVIKERYGVNAPIEVPEFQEKAKQTSLERYGSEWAMQSDEVKEKAKQSNEERYGGIGLASPILRERITATNLERYGAEFPLASTAVVETIKKNNLEKYGSEWGAATSPEANAKRRATNIERYGAPNPWGSKEIQERIRAFWTEKYGGPNPMYDPEMARITTERQQATMIERYGVNASVYVPEIKEKIKATNRERYGADWFLSSRQVDHIRISSYNRKFGEWLDRMGVPYEFEYRIDEHGRPFDLGLTGTNILIEIDPTESHNSIWSPWGEANVREPFYHLEKTQLAEEGGYRCIHVFNWDSQPLILSMLKPKTKIYARNCTVQQIDKRTADIFTARYHLQSKCNGQNLVYGLYSDGELIQMMSFGKPRYAKKEGFTFELLRLCTKFGVQVLGGPSKLFSRFKKDNPEASVISYCDRAKFTGKVYEELGMKLIRTTPPNKIWSKGSKYITDNLLRQRGYDQLFNTNYGKGTSNEELMIENKWYPVYDCGQLVFSYNK